MVVDLIFFAKLIIVGRSSPTTSELLYTRLYGIVYYRRDRNVWRMDIPEVDRDFRFSPVNDLDTPPQ